MNWGALLSAIIPVAIGIIFIWKKTGKILKAMDELADVLEIIPRALADQKLTPEETAAIKKEITEAIESFKDILRT